MVKSSAKITPYMGFVVEPYSYFLCYEIEDIKRAEELLPDGFKLVKTQVFNDDTPKYYGIFGCFNAHTSGFWGMRVEFYIIAENINTGLMSWIIIDYDTNTITYDPKNVLGNPNALMSLITVDYDGDLYVDVVNKDGRKLIFNSKTKSGKMFSLNKRLWIEGNLSIAYGNMKSGHNTDVFSLTFDPLEFEEALRIPLEAIDIKENNWFNGLFKDKPSELVCFPYSQHFLSDSPGSYSHLTNEKELVNKVNKIDFNKIDVFSTRQFKTTFLLCGMFSIVSNAILITMLIMK